MEDKEGGSSDETNETNKKLDKLLAVVGALDKQVRSIVENQSTEKGVSLRRRYSNSGE